MSHHLFTIQAQAKDILITLKNNNLFKTFLGKFYSRHFEENEDCVLLHPIEGSHVSNILTTYEVIVRDKDISELDFLQNYLLGYVFKVSADLLKSFNQDQDQNQAQKLSQNEDKNKIQHFKDVYLISYSNLKKQPEYSADFKSELVKEINVPEIFQDCFEKMTKKHIMFDNNTFSSLNFAFHDKENKDFNSSPLIIDNVQMFYIGDLQMLFSANIADFTGMASNLLIKNNIDLLEQSLNKENGLLNNQSKLFDLLKLNTIITTQITNHFLYFARNSRKNEALKKIEDLAQDLRTFYLL